MIDGLCIFNYLYTVSFFHLVLLISDQGIVTSAGIASGIDMAISLIEQQYGPHFAALVARYLVIYLRRNGSQPQHSAYLEYRNHLHPGVHQVQNWLAEHAMSAVSLPLLAQIANMSVRNFSRAFKQATGLRDFQKINYATDNNDNHLKGGEGAAVGSPFCSNLNND